jgi:tol-pal system protein YbgF
MTRTILRLTAFAVLMGLISAGGAARAQQQDMRDVLDRIERLERDLNILQSQFYRSQAAGNASGTTVITSPAAGGGSGAPLSGDAYSQLDQRISGIEDQMRNLTGQVEKANHDATELNARLDRMQQDNDIRFKEVEQKVGIGMATSAGAQPPAPAAGQAVASNAPQSLTGAPDAGSSANKPGEEKWNPTMGSAPHPLGQLSESDLKKLAPKNADAAASTKQASAAPAPQPAAKTPQEQYDAAFSMLRNNNNDGATKAFQAFLAQHPKDPLAGNATFWLGQIAFSQGKFEQAAPIFFESYTKYPKSAKAGESLLKVGLSMSNLGKKKEACAALARFTSEFPDASEGLKRQAVGEKQKLGCGG